MRPARSNDPRDHLIVALDFPTKDQAIATARGLQGLVRWVKVGLELYIAGGPAVVAKLVTMGFEVMLDLKLNDIPETLARATAAICGQGATLFTAHASSAPKGLRAAAERKGAMLQLGVTALTSLDDEDCMAVYNVRHDAAASNLAHVASQGECDGIVCAAGDVEMLQNRFPHLFTVVPGIRLPTEGRHDQAMAGTPEAALASGARFLVVGRPITRAEDGASPADACRRMLGHIEAGIATYAKRRAEERQALIAGLFSIGAVKIAAEGEPGFAMKSTPIDGKCSPIYLNLRTPSNKDGPLAPEIVACMAAEMGDLLLVREGAFDAIVGIPEAGVPFASALRRYASPAKRAPVTLTKKGKGDSRRIDVFVPTWNTGSSDKAATHTLPPGSRILLVDDLVTRALTKEEAVAAIVNAGYVVAGIVLFADRGQGGLAELNAKGIRTEAAVHVPTMIRERQDAGLLPANDAKRVLGYLATS